MLECHFHLHAVLCPFAVDDIIIDRCGAPVQILDKFLNSALIMIGFASDGVLSFIGQSNFQSLCQKCHLSQTDLQRLKIKFCHFKDLFVRKKADRSPGQTRLTGTDHLQRITYLSPFVPLSVELSLAADRNLQPFGKRIDDRSSHSMESAGYLISSAAEFSARVQDCEYHLHCRLSRFMIDPGWDPSPVIFHCDGIICMNRHLDVSAVPGKRLINGIIHDLIYQMMKSFDGYIINVHAGSFPDRFESLQNLDLVRTIFYTHL